MRSIFKISLVVPIIFLIFFQVSVSSCTKEKIVYDTIVKIKNDTIVRNDTIVKQDTMLSLEIFTANAWQIFEERGVIGGLPLYYLRGGTNNTQSFDNEYIFFKTDKTAIYVQNNGLKPQVTWDFANPEHTKVTWTMYNTPATFTVTWDNIRYKNKNLFMDQYFVDGNTGNHNHSQQIRIPKAN